MFTHRDLKLYFKNKKLKPANLTRIIAYMKSNRKLYTIRKGVYTFRKDIMVAGFAYSPFYYGLLSALTIRELWTQNSRPDIVTIRKVRQDYGELLKKISRKKPANTWRDMTGILLRPS
ncbi:hypothetical protein M1384_01145 [Candidatus Parvarchaeota archaeon]|nr:hypothetical protein [Candidatus Parvarchaeota archaeon]